MQKQNLIKRQKIASILVRLIFIASVTLGGVAIFVYSPLSFEDWQSWKRSGISEYWLCMVPAFCVHVTASAIWLAKNRNTRVVAASASLIGGSGLLLWLIFVTAKVS